MSPPLKQYQIKSKISIDTLKQIVSNDVMTLEQFEQHLKNHDWYFEYSDDHGVWQRGQTSFTIIQNVLRANQDNPKYLELYNNHKPKNV